MSAIAQLLKAARTEANLTQEGVAAEANISLTTMQRVESGRTTPTPEVLFTLARILKVPHDKLETAALSDPDRRRRVSRAT